MTVPTLQKLLYAAILLAVLGLVVCVAAFSTAAFEGVYKPVPAGAASSIRTQAARPRPAEYYSSCWKTGDPDAPPTDTARRGTGAMQFVRERYKLYSTFFVRSPNKEVGYAAIACDRQERVYEENEMVGEYLLARVFPDSVILKKGGASFTLERDSAAAQSARPSSSRSPGRTSRRAAPKRREREARPGTVRPGAAAPAGADTQRFTVSEEDRDYITENFAKILHDVNLQTEIAEEGGAMTGIRIGHVKPGSILHRVGNLRPGDIIRKVHGKPVNSVRQAVSIYESLTKRKVKKVDVEIERNGKIFNRTYSITKPGAG